MQVTQKDLELAAQAARFVTEKHDELVIEFVKQEIREKFGIASGRWTRYYEGYDDMPGGDWYIGLVKDGYGRVVFNAQDTQEEDWLETINSQLGVLFEWGDDGEIREAAL